MFRTAHTLGCILVLIVVAVLVTPGISQAQRGGGRGGGGGHYGGASVGGYHPGAYHGAAYSGGYRPGYGNYRYPYANYGYRPYYGSYGYDPFYDGGATYATPSSDTYQSFYPPPAVIPSDTSAHIAVSVPADAQIWFDDTATTSTGTLRQFNSPALTSGNFSYEIKARWSENGNAVTQTQKVEVTPGAHASVSFPIPPRKSTATKER